MTDGFVMLFANSTEFVICDSNFTEINISCQNPMQYSELEPPYYCVLSASERDSANSFCCALLPVMTLYPHRNKVWRYTGIGLSVCLFVCLSICVFFWRALYISLQPLLVLIIICILIGLNGAVGTFLPRRIFRHICLTALITP
jgi:hypothetical protein